MVPAHATVKLKLLCLLVVQVHTSHLGSSEALASTAKTASSTTTWESHIIRIICVGHQEYLHVILHHTTEDTARVTVLSTYTQVGIHHHTLVHTSLDTEVEHCLFLAILDA